MPARQTITLTENACIKITKGELIITDCTGQGKIVFPKDGIAVEKKYQAGKLTFFGGTIRGSANGDSDRTGIRVMNGAEFLMYGGVIENSDTASVRKAHSPCTAGPSATAT